MAKVYPPFKIIKEEGGNTIEINSKTVGDLLNELEKRYGDDFKSSTKFAQVLVNGVSINYLNGKSTKLKAEDEVWFVTPAGGG